MSKAQKVVYLVVQKARVDRGWQLVYFGKDVSNRQRKIIWLLIRLTICNFTMDWNLLHKHLNEVGSKQ